MSNMKSAWCTPSRNSRGGPLAGRTRLVDTDFARDATAQGLRERAQSPSSLLQVNRDRFETLAEVQAGLRSAGLEASELIVAIDFTKSNQWAGEKSFNGEDTVVHWPTAYVLVLSNAQKSERVGKSLHATDMEYNPYKSVISAIANTLATFDEDHQIAAYGFGDIKSKEHSLIGLSPGGKPIDGLDNVLAAYQKLVPTLSLSGPTSFAPAIYKAIELVKVSGGAFHILLIIADGQVSGGKCFDETVRAIVEASYYPLSIVMVGVGDGPWDMMNEFDDGLPARNFDNFQFVNFTEIMERAARGGHTSEMCEAEFALTALMEVPDQYAAVIDRNLLLTNQGRPIKLIKVLRAVQ